MNPRPLRLLVLAHNIVAGGGLVHLRELLRGLDQPGWLESITLATARPVCDQPPRHYRLREVVRQWPTSLGRFASQAWSAPGKRADFDLLFAPGGTYFGSFRPFVTMAQNLLPFQPEEHAGYRLWPNRLRNQILYRLQGRTFRRADGLIHLTHYARQVVESRLPSLRARPAAVVYHGVNRRFRVAAPATRKPAEEFRLCYVSIFDLHKHQDQVARAVAQVRAEGVPVRCQFIGPVGYGPSYESFRAVCREVDPQGTFLEHGSATGYGRIDEVYRSSDAMVFASTCETFGMIVLEAMAAGLPIAASDKGGHAEILGEEGLFFQTARVESIARALRILATDPARRQRLAEAAHQRSQLFSWERCAGETLQFWNAVAFPARTGQRPSEPLSS